MLVIKKVMTMADPCWELWDAQGRGSGGTYSSTPLSLASSLSVPRWPSQTTQTGPWRARGTVSVAASLLRVYQTRVRIPPCAPGGLGVQLRGLVKEALSAPLSRLWIPGEKAWHAVGGGCGP